jgi:hypothetical protein
MNPIPFHQIDQWLDRLYEMARPDFLASGNGRADRNSARGPSTTTTTTPNSSVKKGWTKKDLQRHIDQIPTSVSFRTKNLMEATLRQVAKAGPCHVHLMLPTWHCSLSSRHHLPRPSSIHPYGPHCGNCHLAIRELRWQRS